MIKIAHIINVTELNEAKKASYLHVAQPLTMKSMVIAKKIAQDIVNVDLVAVKHRDESVNIPSAFRWIPDIDGYAWEYIDELKDVHPRKPLPRLRDIIQGLYDSSDAEYFIYTNLDIGLYPDFYLTVNEIIQEGYDAFCINRRDLPKEYKGMLLDESKIELIFPLEGIKHAGIDCFVFRKGIVPSINLGNVYIGYPPVGQVLKSQLEANADNFAWIKDAISTFHLGSDKAWRNGKGEYFTENMKQAEGLYIESLRAQPPPHRSQPHKPLFPIRFAKKMKSRFRKAVKDKR